MLAKLKDKISELYEKSFCNNNEMIVDVPFTLEETEAAIKNLKTRKSGGFDNLQAEHLKYGGNFLCAWIQQVCNGIVELESIPDVLKQGLYVLYTGKGKKTL